MAATAAAAAADGGMRTWEAATCARWGWFATIWLAWGWQWLWFSSVDEAKAMEAMFDQMAPGQTDVRIVDVWTEYCPFPFSHFVQSYQHMAKHPWIWRSTWYSSAWAPNEKFLNFASWVRCGAAFRRCIDDHDPDLVVSIHPLTQHIPLRVLEQKARQPYLLATR